MLERLCAFCYLKGYTIPYGTPEFYTTHVGIPALTVTMKL